ncbi:hypothetical protein ANTRET_LOCUS4185 [Anthophora retusa]
MKKKKKQQEEEKKKKNKKRKRRNKRGEDEGEDDVATSGARGKDMEDRICRGYIVLGQIVMYQLDGCS